MLALFKQWTHSVVDMKVSEKEDCPMSCILLVVLVPEEEMERCR